MRILDVFTDWLGLGRVGWQKRCFFLLCKLTALGVLFLVTMITMFYFGMTRYSAAASGDYALWWKVRQQTAGMTPEEKAGQLMMVGITGTELDGRTKADLQVIRPAGFVFFDRNLLTKEQVQKLSADLQQFSRESTGMPAFIAIDEEGGAVARMKNILPPPPSAAQLAQSGDVDLAYAQAKETAQKLREFGINVNFAPVADIGMGRGRSYGNDAATVEKFAAAAARGYRDGGVFFCLKHFPGMGRAKVDPHHDGSVIAADKDLLLQEDLRPFRSIITAVQPNDFFIMVGHLTYAAFDNQPASLSPAVMTELLHRELGFKGLAITDDIDMGAVHGKYPDEELGVRAIAAGVDLVLVCHRPEQQRRVYDGIVAAIKNGTLPQQRVDEAVQRVLYQKMKYLAQ